MNCSRFFLLIFSVILIVSHPQAQTVELKHKDIAAKLLGTGLRNCEGFSMLKELCEKAPHRLSGSEGAATAVELTKKMMTERGFDKVHLESIMVPHWARGEEECWIIPEASIMPQTMRLQRLEVCALGGSIATPDTGFQAEIVELKNFDELRKIGKKAKGKIIFYNRAFDPTK
ncbi:MAG: peptidase M28 family protein, partial [Bacteroidota bacterium]